MVAVDTPILDIAFHFEKHKHGEGLFEPDDKWHFLSDS